jgi:SHS2 domain-containing protein
MRKFKFLEHTADIKFQAYGKNLNEVFENSAYAMLNVLSESKIKSKIKKNIHVKGRDLENLLYNFLEELLFLFDSENFILSKIRKIKIDKKNFKLKAEITGDKSSNYKINLGIKAVTYNEMFVKKMKDKWVSQVVIDV